jgi:glyoxylase-like metal-dependent hydrolase (beta-lactamase superfamily II)
MFTRRYHSATALLFVVASILHAQQGAAEDPGPPPNLVHVKDDLYVVANDKADGAGIRNFGGNATIFLTDAGVLLVDSKNDREHDDLIAKVKSLTDKPIKYVILTHNHGDHAAGAPKLEAMGATILISTDDRDNMLRAANPAWLPQVTYIWQARLYLGGKEAQLYQYRGHTRGDTVVYFPADRVLCAGDLVTTADTIPLIVNYPDGGSWMDWSKSIDEILKIDFDVLIPGHGPAVGKSRLVEIRNKMVAVRERVRAMVRDKKTQDEIAQTIVKEFGWGQGGAAAQFAPMMQELR